MNAMLEMLFTMAVAGSVVAACVLFLRKVPVDLFPAKWRYRLQKIAILFFLLPIAVGISWVWPLIGSHPATAHDSPSVSDGVLMAAEPHLSVPAIPASAAFVMLGIWAIGAIGLRGGSCTTIADS